MDLLKLDTMKWTFGTYLDRPLERKMCFSLLILKSRHKMCTYEKMHPPVYKIMILNVRLLSL